MLCLRLLPAFALFTSAPAISSSRDCERPRVVVVGAGVAGVSAAALLLQHGHHDVTVLEASDRIGGRTHTVQFEGVTVEEGAEFVHGQKNNTVYETVSPYNLLESYAPLVTTDKQLFVNTSGHVFNSSEVSRLDDAAHEILEDEAVDDFEGSVADYFYPRLDKLLEERGVRRELGEAVRRRVELEEGVSNAADSLAALGARGYTQYQEAEGDQLLKWRTGGYQTFHQFLMKKLPIPSEELPVLNKTLFGKRVTLISLRDEDEDGGREGEREGVEVHCEDGSKYLAHNVIFTPSLGVLKKHAHSMFRPPLPANHTAAIQALGFGTVAKVFLRFPVRWWPENINVIIPLFSQQELKTFKNNSVHGWWVADSSGFWPVVGDQRMLCVWMSGQASRSMETLSDDQVVDGFLELLQKTLGQLYNVSRPDAVFRSRWHSNPLTLGTYSFRTVESDRLGLSNSDLARPVLDTRGKPVILFAGEATHPHSFSTVHGALETGRREARRLIDHLNSQQKSPCTDI